MTIGGAAAERDVKEVALLFRRSGEPLSLEDPQQRSATAHSLRGDSLIAAPIKSLRKALMSQPRAEQQRDGPLRKHQNVSHPVQPAREDPGGQAEHGRCDRAWRRPLTSCLRSNISSTINQPQPAESMEEAERQLLTATDGRNVYGRSRASTASLTSAKSSPPREKGQTCLGEGVEHGAWQRQSSARSCRWPEAGSAAKEEQGPRAIADRGPHRAGTTVGGRVD
jgi:hypothetical protein